MAAKDAKKAPKGLALMIGIGGPKMKKGDSEMPPMPEEEGMESGMADEAIREMFSLAQSDPDAAVAAFKDVIDIILSQRGL